ncbi:hypothetical protein, partial [Streptomyces chartreusis]
MGLLVGTGSTATGALPSSHVLDTRRGWRVVLPFEEMKRRECDRREETEAVAGEDWRPWRESNPRNSPRAELA